MAASLSRRLRRVPLSVWLAGLMAVVIVAAAALAPLIAPFDPTDLTSFNLIDAELPPRFSPEGDPRFLLGTDNQGRDLLSAMLYGARVSILIGGGAVLVAAVVGVGLGLVAGYFGGWVDAAIMRFGDIILSFPTILLALLVAGVTRMLFPAASSAEWAPFILVGAIAIHEWVQYARTVRGSVMVEKNKEYVQAARVIGLSPMLIMIRHVLPNVTGPVLVIATINLGLAIITEATLSFLGVGLPSTEPSLGTLIRLGNEVLQSGDWWITVFPGITLAALVLAVNLLGDWLRDALNPKLR